MLTLQAPQAETLWGEVLPIEARELPEDLARLDELLCDPELLRPIACRWRREAAERGRSAVNHGRPTIAMETYVRLMVVKQRSGWGYETLVKEVSDSLHLRRFCLIPVHERVPDESTIRKLTRRGRSRSPRIDPSTITSPALGPWTQISPGVRGAIGPTPPHNHSPPCLTEAPGSDKQ